MAAAAVHIATGGTLGVREVCEAFRIATEQTLATYVHEMIGTFPEIAQHAFDPWTNGQRLLPEIPVRRVTLNANLRLRTKTPLVGPPHRTDAETAYNADKTTLIRMLKNPFPSGSGTASGRLVEHFYLIHHGRLAFRHSDAMRALWYQGVAASRRFLLSEINFSEKQLQVARENLKRFDEIFGIKQ